MSLVSRNQSLDSEIFIDLIQIKNPDFDIKICNYGTVSFGGITYQGYPCQLGSFGRSEARASLTVPLIPSLEEVLKLITGEEAYAISETETFKRILSAINEQKIEEIITNLGVLKGGKVLSEVSFNKIISLLKKTRLDPNYQSQIYMSEVELAGFEVVLVNEIEELLTT